MKGSKSIGSAKGNSGSVAKGNGKKTFGFSSGKGGSKLAAAGSKARFGTNIQGPSKGC